MQRPEFIRRYRRGTVHLWGEWGVPVTRAEYRQRWKGREAQGPGDQVRGRLGWTLNAKDRNLDSFTQQQRLLRKKIK